MQNGTPLVVLQELGGWEGSDMVRRYAHLAADHLAADHLAPYADKLGGLDLVGTNRSQPQKDEGATSR